VRNYSKEAEVVMTEDEGWPSESACKDRLQITSRCHGAHAVGLAGPVGRAGRLCGLPAISRKHGTDHCR
jgi:hypothetical protein